MRGTWITVRAVEEGERENAPFWKAPTNEILDRPPGSNIAALSLRSLNRAANICEEFNEVVSRSLSTSFSFWRYLVNHGSGFYDVCANVGIASPTYAVRLLKIIGRKIEIFCTRITTIGYRIDKHQTVRLGSIVY